MSIDPSHKPLNAKLSLDAWIASAALGQKFYGALAEHSLDCCWVSLTLSLVLGEQKIVAKNKRDNTSPTASPRVYGVQS